MGKGLEYISSKKIYKWPISTLKDAQHHQSLGKCKSKPQQDSTSHPLRWLLAIKWKITSFGNDVEKLEHLCIASGNVKYYSCCGKEFSGSSKS